MNGLTVAVGARQQCPPPTPLGGGQTINGSIVKSDDSCEVTEGKFIKTGTELKVHILATADGQCQTYIQHWVPYYCEARPLQERTVNKGVIDGLYLSGSNPFFVNFMTVTHYHVLDSHNSNTTGPITWLPLLAGDYLVSFKGNIDVTSCNMTPASTDIYLLGVHVRTALHKGSPCDGSLVGGSKLPMSGTGYYHSLGTDPPDTDNWAGNEALINLIKDVAASWNFRHSSPNVGVLDLSKLGGGQFAPHACHQNGTEADIRYMRNDSVDGPLDFDINPGQYSESLTLEILQLLYDTGEITDVWIDPDAGISSDDIPGLTFHMDDTGEHSNHFHVRTKDLDGDDNNVCWP